MESIHLYTSKKKSALILLGSLAFVAGGTWMVLYPSATRKYSEIFIYCIGIIAILFFGACAVIAAWQLLKDRLALIIDNNGLIINPGKFGQKIIDWGEIKGFSEYTVNRQNFVVIEVKDNEYQISKETNSFKKQLMKVNINMYGSPYALCASIYKINHNELLALLQKNFTSAQQRI